MPAYEAEFLGMTQAQSEEGLGVVLVTLRLNRSKGSLAPIALEFTRSQIERIVEDGAFILSNTQQIE